MLEGDLKNYKKKLERAINAALTDSPHITEAIQDIREEGFDVFLIVEATIGFNLKDSEAPSEETPPLNTVELKLSIQDARFLRRYGIRPD